ncbi:dephospho-CoA kinase [Laspinema olomoucense]|uniref:Dephospho-CoA kinase n=1 Tax=Laspinema olomoucense D3b TaxID=2953688 RepID=A0ABT2NEV3_9CYAN|nr:MULTISPECIES: dephospho-CoA kinase [unclassified Laspinema]MCT7979776.1 dephospho-CoA kinase [Laspinema sp. D3b]MCT7990625.1 dephospho-CoA kinase [Laspinema sp. D3a]MCT7993479.1 dephospho-CoA kinase [Laspinema sp. D3c]
MKNKRKIGLTGGIATGKTTVSNYLKNIHQLPVFDADIYAREAVQIGSPVLNQIVKRYGSELLLPDRSLNRQKLGEIVFNQPQEKQWLEEQIHPQVRDRFLREIAALPEQSTAVLVIPLLFEAQMTDLVTEIWVVSCPGDRQIQRLMERDGLTLDQARARINSQMPLFEKCDRADIVLDNSSTLEHLIQQIDVALMQDRDNRK